MEAHGVRDNPLPEQEPYKGRMGVRLRALLIGLGLMTLNIFWITTIEVRWYTLDVTSLPIFITPVFTLFVLALINLGVTRWRPAWRLSAVELLIIYI
ncbi:MAG: hypothetical protein NZL85_02415, partial [Fimbriimonadales bacterium]|nr:hypothetical protein [Fimbriimonadales bacterium]